MNPLAVHMLLVGAQGTAFADAANLARQQGAEVAVAGSPDAALDHLRRQRTDMVLIDVGFDIAAFLDTMRWERLTAPVLACGIDAPARVAVAAIRAGARDFLPLPPDGELIAAAIAAFATRACGPKEIEALVGHTVADVERELILQTLERCHGNRTSASTILGISVRTMRNKLRTFIEAGIPVSPAA